MHNKIMDIYKSHQKVKDLYAIFVKIFSVIFPLTFISIFLLDKIRYIEYQLHYNEKDILLIISICFAWSLFISYAFLVFEYLYKNKTYNTKSSESIRAIVLISISIFFLEVVSIFIILVVASIIPNVVFFIIAAIGITIVVPLALVVASYRSRARPFLAIAFLLSAIVFAIEGMHSIYHVTRISS